MGLPQLIEMLPLTQPVRAAITVPGSKSITNRALILAALGAGQTALRGALWSEDTQVMVAALLQLGFEVKVEPDPDELCNRIITVRGLGGKIPKAGTAGAPLDLFVGNAGTAARFLTALVCLGQGSYRLHGVPRMHERPQAALFQALRELGYQLDAPNDKLPVILQGAGPRPGHCRVSIAKSSQFASALLLCAQYAGWQVEISGDNAEESPYVAMTSELIKVFPRNGGTFQIEPDASSGSYFWAANKFIAAAQAPAQRPLAEGDPQSGSGCEPEPGVTVTAWPQSPWQIDAAFPRFLSLPPRVSRQTDLGDSILTAMILAPFASQPVVFTDLGRLRVQECERVAAMRTELTKCNARVIEEGDTLTIFPSPLHGAEIATYDDHRLAMCFAILGLKVPGIRLQNPACVKKTFPNFFQKLAALPPQGLGARVCDSRTGRELSLDELFAD